MHVRQATTADLEAIIGLGVRFVEGSVYREITPATEADVARLSGWLLENGVILLLELEPGRPVGLLGGSIVPNHVNLALFAHEWAWWVDVDQRGHGWALVEAFEAWAWAREAVAVVLVAPVDRRGARRRRPVLERFYRSKRYRLQETTWVKFKEAA